MSDAKLSEEEIARRAKLSPEARKALEEADVRRLKSESNLDNLPKNETGGPSRIEPTRYGDWERKGIAYDF